MEDSEKQLIEVCKKFTDEVLNKEPLKPYQIRIGDTLLNKVKESAKQNERSVNAEMRYLIKVALNKNSE